MQCAADSKKVGRVKIDGSLQLLQSLLPFTRLSANSTIYYTKPFCKVNLALGGGLTSLDLTMSWVREGLAELLCCLYLVVSWPHASLVGHCEKGASKGMCRHSTSTYSIGGYGAVWVHEEEACLLHSLWSCASVRYILIRHSERVHAPCITDTGNRLGTHE